MLALEYEPMSLRTFQQEQAAWVARQPFAGGPSWHPLLGIVEEVGELAHAYLKQEQGIRGTAAEHTEAKKDAVGDVLTYLADYCTREGFDMQEVLETVWAQVSERNWNANRETGQAKRAKHRLGSACHTTDHDFYSHTFDH